MFVNCMLLVINGEANEPVCYSSKIVDDIVKEVDKACIELDIDNSEDEVRAIANYLESGSVAWTNDEVYCFQIIPVK